MFDLASQPLNIAGFPATVLRLTENARPRRPSRAVLIAQCWKCVHCQDEQVSCCIDILIWYILWYPLIDILIKYILWYLARKTPTCWALNLIATHQKETHLATCAVNTSLMHPNFQAPACSSNMPRPAKRARTSTPDAVEIILPKLWLDPITNWTYICEDSICLYSALHGGLRPPYPVPCTADEMHRWPRILLSRVCQLFGEDIVKRQLRA